MFLSVDRKVIIGKPSTRLKYLHKTNSLPMTVTQTVTASYGIPQSSLITICEDLAKVKQTNHQLRRNTKLIPPKPSYVSQLAVTKPVTTP